MSGSAFTKSSIATPVDITKGGTGATIASQALINLGAIPYTGATTNVDLGAYSLTVDTNTLFVDSVNHRVGIGTTAPTQKFEIIDGADSIKMGKYNTGGYASIWFNQTTPSNSNYGFLGNNSDTWLNASSQVVLAVNDTEKVIVSSTSIIIGNNLVLNNHCINATTTLSTNQSYTGTYEVATVGEAVVFGDVLYLKFSDGKYWKAKADAYTTTPATRMALATIAANGSGNLLIEGLVRYDSWSFASANVWLSAATAGAITTTQPATTGNQIQKIGIAFSSTKLQFRPSFDIGEK